jgi:hypothetical protein
MSENANSLPQASRRPLVLAGDALVFAFGFVFRNPGAILRRLAVPGVLGCITLYILLWGYCTQLTDFLGFPSEGLASRVMGIAAVAILIMLLLHAIVVARLGALLAGQTTTSPVFLGISATAWRIYAADLRLVLAFGVYGVAILLAINGLNRLAMPPVLPALLSVAGWLLLVWLLARCWFFLAPVSLRAQDEGVLVLCWRQSEGLLLPMILVLLLLTGVMLILLSGGELLLRAGGILSPVPEALSFAGAIGFYERNLWPFVLLVSLVYLVGTSLMTAARVRLYQDAVDAPTA